MPKQVWKCDYCILDYFEEENKALEHESTCSSNELNKKCTTCEYYTETGYPISGSDMRCMNKDCGLFNENISYFFEDDENNKENQYFPCKFWKRG